MQSRNLGPLCILAGVLVVAGCQNEAQERQATPVTRPAVTSSAEMQAAAPRAAESHTTIQPPEQELTEYVPPKRPPQEMMLVSIPVTDSPTVDGRADEPVWATAPAITTLDFSSQRPITLKSVYTTTEAFFLVTFPDDTPSETHKPWMWDPKEEIYREGPDREDVFIFKWSMSGNDVSLTLRDPQHHRADIWFWKAHRTNPAGYADDKGQSVSPEPGPDTRKIGTSPHGPLYFRRWGDAGEAPYEEKFFFEYIGPTLTKYVPRQPIGSRGDVRAKGRWHDGQWTIELARQLVTGQSDDVTFLPGRAHLFGVSCYAMAYDIPHETWSQPLYRTGDVFDRLFFTMAPGEDQ